MTRMNQIVWTIQYKYNSYYLKLLQNLVILVDYRFINIYVYNLIYNVLKLP